MGWAENMKNLAAVLIIGLIAGSAGAVVLFLRGDGWALALAGYSIIGATAAIITGGLMHFLSKD